MPEKASAFGCDELRTSSAWPSFPDLRPQSWSCSSKQQIAAGGAVLHCKRRQSVIFGVKLRHAAKIDRADDVDVVQNERLFGGPRILQEEVSGFFQAAAGIEQNVIFAGNLDAHAEILCSPSGNRRSCRRSDAR